MDIVVGESLPARIADVKALCEELEEIETNIKALPFNENRNSRGPNAANMQVFQNSLQQIVSGGREVMLFAMIYLQASYDTFVKAG